MNVGRVRRYVLVQDPGAGRSIRRATAVTDPVESIEEAVELRTRLYPDDRSVRVAAWDSGRVEALTRREEGEVARILHNRSRAEVSR